MQAGMQEQSTTGQLSYVSGTSQDMQLQDLLIKDGSTRKPTR